MNQINFAKFFLAITIVAFVISTIDAAADRQVIRVKRNQRSAKHASEKPELGEACPCPRILWRVCGSDGRDYDNECILNCAAKTRTDLRLVKNVPCDEEDELEAMPFLP